MNVKQRIRMTASEIVMGRYMRAPDHPPADDEFTRAFAAEVLTDAAGGGGNDGNSGAAPAAGAGGDGDAAPTGEGAGAAAGGEGQGDGAAAPDDKGAAPSGDGGSAPAASPPADDKGDKGAAGGKGADAGDGSGGDAGAGAAAADGGGAGKTGTAPGAVADEGVDTDAIIDRLAEAVAKRGPTKVEAPAAEAPAAAEAPPLFNDEETTTLAKFKEDWPQEHQAVQLMQRELGHGVIKYVFDQMAPVVKEIKDLAETLAYRAQFGDVTEALTEYPSDEEIDHITEWVKTQPTYLQAGMNGVIQSGTPDEVVDLVSRYREANGKQPAGAQEQPKPKGDVELSGAAKQAAAALAPVDTKRSVVQNPDDSSDFDAGWVKFKDMTV